MTEREAISRIAKILASHMSLSEYPTQRQLQKELYNIAEELDADEMINMSERLNDAAKRRRKRNQRA